MKKIKNLFNNALTLVILFALGVGLALFLSSRSQNSQPAAQAPDSTSPLSTPTPVVETATPAPATPTAGPPPDDTPEPTWTPVIILPEAPPPTLPPPPPTLTPTPVNPKESLIVKLPNAAGNLALSPDGQTLAFDQAESPRADTYPQFWTLDLVSKKIAKLADKAYSPVWSPGGGKIAFQVIEGPVASQVIEVKIISKDGKEEKTLAKGSEILNYYWLATDALGIINTTGITVLDSTGKTKEQVNFSLPATEVNGVEKPKVKGHPEKFVVVNVGGELLVKKKNGEVTVIADEINGDGRSIYDFDLSPDGKRIAYIVGDGPNDELWVTDLKGKDKRLLYRAEHATVGFPTWSPDSKVILVGLRSRGTHDSDDLELALISPENGQLTRLNVDKVDRGFIWTYSGNGIIYGRTVTDKNNGTASTNFYQLEVKP